MVYHISNLTSPVMKTTTITKSTNVLLNARKSSMSEFIGIEHRLELITEINGTEYINDSKATDFSATLFSLSCMSRPVIWIVGTSEMQQDFSVFSDLVKEKVKAIVTLGKNKEKNLETLKTDVRYFSQVSSVAEAVEAASAFAAGGDVILFSPACPSFDMFENYKQRGECFKEEVRRW